MDRLHPGQTTGRAPAPARSGRSSIRRLAAVGTAILAVSLMALTSAPAADASTDAALGDAYYYLDCAAPTNGDGSATAPWNSTASVNMHGAFVPGDHILLLRGTTCSGRLAPDGSGIADHPIVIGAYGSGAKPTIDGGGTPNDTGTVTLRNQHDWTVQDLHLTNKVTTKITTLYRSGLLLLNESGGRLANLTAQRLTIDSVDSSPVAGFHGPRLFGGIAALTFGSSGDGFDHLRILHDVVSHIGRSGIVTYNSEYPASFDTDVRIGYDTVRWARGDGIILTGAKGGRIDHSVNANGADFWPCSQCHGISTETANAGIWAARAENVRIDHDEVYGEHRLGGDGEGIDIDKSAEHVTVEANYVHDNQGGGILFCHAIDVDVRFNILQNNTRAEFVFTTETASRNVHIYNNTIYVAKSVAANSVVRLKKGHGAKGTQFINNIVYSYGHSTYRWQGPVTARSNTFIGHHSPTEPKGPGTSYANPLLRGPGHGSIGMASVGGYRFRAPSHVQRGAPIPKSATTDYFGSKVDPKHPPRGASVR